MNNLFTPQQDTLITRIANLQAQAKSLVEQRRKVRGNRLLRDAYTIAITEILEAIERLALEIQKSKESEE